MEDEYAEMRHLSYSYLGNIWKMAMARVAPEKADGSVNTDAGRDKGGKDEHQP